MHLRAVKKMAGLSKHRKWLVLLIDRHFSRVHDSLSFMILGEMCLVLPVLLASR